MASFPLKKHTFSYPIYSTLNLKMFPLHCIPKILYAESIYTELIIRAKSFLLWPKAYPQYIITNRHMDRWETDDNGTIDT